MPEVLLGFGGNLGDPVASIGQAIALLDRRGAAVTRRSSLYRTPPWGPIAQPDFVNCCAVAETTLAPLEFLAVTQAVERDLGRTPGEPRYGPRPIDIDILDYDGRELDAPGLALPHRRIAERAFVLVPLAEIAPDRVIAGRRVDDLARSADRTGIVRLR